MAERPLIAVLGATGGQGGSLARALLAGGAARAFDVRAVTRKVASPAARELATLGAEIAFGDLDEPASLEHALADAHGVFAMTSFWEHFSPERELAQAGNIARAAKAAAVRHVVWSTLEDTRERVPLADSRMPTLMQQYKVPHFDAKGEADALFRELPTTYLRSAFRWENLLRPAMSLRRGIDGGLRLVLPMGYRKLAGIAAADVGACALAIFRRGEDFVGRTIGIAGEHLTGAEMAAALTRTLGETVRHLDMPHCAYAQLGFPAAEDLANMFQYLHDFSDEFLAQRPVAATRELHPRLMSFTDWLDVNAWRIARPPLAV